MLRVVALGRSIFRDGSRQPRVHLTAPHSDVACPGTSRSRYDWTPWTPSPTCVESVANITSSAGPAPRIAPSLGANYNSHISRTHLGIRGTGEVAARYADAADRVAVIGADHQGLLQAWTGIFPGRRCRAPQNRRCSVLEPVRNTFEKFCHYGQRVAIHAGGSLWTSM